jgi:hypothetical protein
MKCVLLFGAVDWILQSWFSVADWRKSEFILSYNSICFQEIYTKLSMGFVLVDCRLFATVFCLFSLCIRLQILLIFSNKVIFCFKGCHLVVLLIVQQIKSVSLQTQSYLLYRNTCFGLFQVTFRFTVGFTDLHNKGNTQMNGAVLIVFNIKTAPLFCVYSVYIITFK